MWCNCSALPALPGWHIMPTFICGMSLVNKLQRQQPDMTLQPSPGILLLSGLYKIYHEIVYLTPETYYVRVQSLVIAWQLDTSWEHLSLCQIVGNGLESILVLKQTAYAAQIVMCWIYENIYHFLQMVWQPAICEMKYSSSRIYNEGDVAWEFTKTRTPVVPIWSLPTKLGSGV
jgi:hypothetical protein